MSERKLFGYGSIILLGINAIIGSGIFLLPGKAYALEGINSLWIYGIDTVLALILALVFAEAASRFDKTGGPYIYAKEAFGDFVGFEVGFLKWAVGIVAWATIAVGFATALGALWPWAATPEGKNTVAITLVVLLGLVNLFGVPLTKAFNNVVTVGKLVPLILVAAVGIFAVTGGSWAPELTTPDFGTSFIPAVILVFYAFTGFESIGVAAGEVKDPKRRIPVAILVGIGTAAVLYVLIQIVSVGVLGADLAKSTTPVAGVANKLFGPFGLILVSVGALVSIGGITVAQSFIAPRSGVALSESGVLPEFLSKVNGFGAPAGSIIVTTLLAVPLILSGSFVQLAAISVLTRFAQYIPTSIAVLVLRRTAKDKPALFRIPLGPLVPILGALLSTALLVYAGVDKGGLEKLAWGVGALVVGVPVYFIFRAWKRSHTLKSQGENS